MSNQSPQYLVQRCRNIHDGAGAAIGWVNEVRRDSQRLDRESDSLVDKLRRVRNLCGRLGRAAARPVSVGFFGLSQAGKSYLISAMAAGTNGELETELDGERLNFIQHVNPPGHGKEATGLVTRFTRGATDAPSGYPLELSLFSEVDLIKVLGNSFFNDFDREQVEVNTAPAYLRKHLAGLESRRKKQPTGGVTEDNVVELLEYFEQRFPRTTEQLKGDYWTTAVELVPYLEPADRGALFSILWGEIPDLTETYLMLRQALARTGFAETVYCPVTALVARDASGQWSQADSIMNVDILERLGRDRADVIELIPRRAGELGGPVSIPRSMLAALTTELKFELADAPRVGLLEEVDLLDFPGYRGRLAVADIAEVRKQLKDDQVDPVAQLVLRGKVAYLFERYTDDQEMNFLILCAPSHKQSDVKDLGPVLETWVHSTQGEDPESRGRRRAGLIWALTMFDYRLNPVPGETEDLMRKGWEGMMKLALLERFGAYNWLHEWSPGSPFDNLFLVRKPRMATAVIETDAGGEHAILPSQVGRLDQLRSTFCHEPSVQKHIAAPGLAWDSMLTFNDGGIARLADYLGSVVSLDVKLERIREQVDAITDELVRHRFGAYYREEGAAEVENKKRLTARVIDALRKRPNRFGDLLSVLQPSQDQLRALYLRADDARDDAAPTARHDASVQQDDGGLIDLGSLLGGTELAPTDGSDPSADSATRFVRSVLSHWIGHLKGLPEDDDWTSYLGIPKDVLEDIVGELITGADRMALEQGLLGQIQGAEQQTAAKRSKLAERQVFAVSARLARYMDFLGCDDLPADERPVSIVDKIRPIFAPPPPIAIGDLPALTAKPVNYSGLFIVDWFEAFRHLAINNAGHAAGRDISPEQNARLGEILQGIGD